VRSTDENRGRHEYLRFGCAALLTVVTLFSCSSAGAEQPVELNDADTAYDVGLSGQFIPDDGARWNNDSVDGLIERFVAGGLPSTDGVESPVQRYWFLFEVRNKTDLSDFVLSFHAPLIRRVVLFDPDASGRSSAESGYDVPVEARVQPALDYAIPVDIEPGEREIIAVLIEDPAGQAPDPGDILLESEARFQTQTFRMIAAALLSLGAVLAVGLYMLLIWMRLREETYLWFGCFALSSFVLWATHYELFRLVIGRDHDFTLLNFLANASSLVFCVLFVRAFLRVQQWSATWNRAALGLVCLLLALLGVTPILGDSAAYLANASAALVTLVLVVSLGAYATLRGVERAGTFLLAWTVYFSTGLLTIADALGAGLPTVSIRLMTAAALALGMLLMAWSVGNQLQELISQKRLAEHKARTDALTQLGNRALFDDQLEQLQHQYDADLISDLLVLFADLDGLKLINDTHGHDVGDALLKDFAGLLEERFRNVDGIFRVGGDEFILLLPDARPTFAEWMPERIDGIIDELRASGHAEASVSIGIAMLSETDGDAGETVRLADERMYEQKGLA
jgi:diguanylate cyclase (GGDEF)-like protein